MSKNNALHLEPNIKATPRAKHIQEEHYLETWVFFFFFLLTTSKGCSADAEGWQLFCEAGGCLLRFTLRLFQFSFICMFEKAKNIQGVSPPPPRNTAKNPQWESDNVVLLSLFQSVGWS